RPPIASLDVPDGARRRRGAPDDARPPLLSAGTHQHAAQAPDRQRHLHDLLTAQLPHRDRALVGRDRILAYLHDFGLRQRNGRALSWRMILRWRRDHGFPLVRGVWHPSAPTHPGSRFPALTTSYAVTAWILTAPPLTRREWCSTAFVASAPKELAPS